MQTCIAYSSRIRGPPRALEGVLGGPEHKGESFIFTIIQSIYNTVTECMQILESRLMPEHD